MFKKFLHALRDTIDEVGSQAAALADDVSAQVDALAGAVASTASDTAARLHSASQQAPVGRPDDSDDSDEVDESGPGRLGKTVTLLALGGVLYAGWTQWNAVHRRRTTSRLRALPEPLHRWEGEGGQNQMVAEAAPLAGQTGDDTLTAVPSSSRPHPPKEL